MLQELTRVLSQVLVPIALMATAGYLLSTFRVIDVRSVSRVVFYILAPCLVYSSIVTMEIDLSTVGRSLKFAAVHMAIMGLAAFLLARHWRYNGSLGKAFILTTILLNDGNYGLPLNLFAFGPQGFNYALVLFMFNSLVGSTIGIYLVVHGAEGARLALRRTLGTPIIWAMLLGFLSRLTGLAASGSLFDMITLGGRSAIPVFLIVLGMSLAQTDKRANLLPVGRLTLLRMAGGPGLAVLLARLLGLTGIPYAVAVLQASMPTAVNSIVISSEFEAAPDFVAGAVFGTTLASLVVLPGLLLWLI